MKYIAVTMVLAFSLYGGIYDTYSPTGVQQEHNDTVQNIEINESEHNNSVAIADIDANVTADFLNQDYFTKVIRYAPVFFDGESMDDNASAVLDRVMKDLNASDMNKSRITIIGHTPESKDVNNTISTNWFVSFFQGVATHEGNDVEEDINLSKKRGEIVYQWFMDQNVSEKIMLVDERAGKDKLFTEGTSEGRDKNNRVDIALYIIADSDQDGVLDPYDACPDTHLGLSVDKYGCSGSLRLDINFKFDSAEVDGEDNSSIESFAKFLIKNPPYDALIIGHTDEQGSSTYNEKLSARRAETIVKMLISYGVDEKRLSAEGKGESEPIITREERLQEKIASLENNATLSENNVSVSQQATVKKVSKKKKIRLTREEIIEVFATNRRIEAHYFLRPEPVVKKKKPKAPRLRFKAK